MEASMMRHSLLAAAALLTGASLLAPAYSQQFTTAATPPKKAGLDPSERICRNIDPTGSRVTTKRVCATRAEWDAREREDKDATQQMQRPVQTCNTMDARRC
jgi:hypothetical protein